jgi:hypothetical protein
MTLVRATRQSGGIYGDVKVDGEFTWQSIVNANRDDPMFDNAVVYEQRLNRYGYLSLCANQWDSVFYQLVPGVDDRCHALHDHGCYVTMLGDGILYSVPMMVDGSMAKDDNGYANWEQLDLDAVDVFGEFGSLEFRRAVYKLFPQSVDFGLD